MQTAAQLDSREKPQAPETIVVVIVQQILQRANAMQIAVDS